MYLRIAVAALILISIKADEGSKYECILSSLPKQDNLCVAQIDCIYGIDDISSKLKQWSCIRHERGYDYYSGYRSYENRVTYDSSYYLIVNVINVDEDAATNTFGNFNGYLEHVKAITVTNGQLVSVPTEIFRMKRVTEIGISNNNVEEIKFRNFLDHTMLNKINASHNSIAVIDNSVDIDEETTRRVQSNIETIDLSYNLIETVPKNCFASFGQLKHLNLSNNNIVSFDIFTFEGLSQLQSLHLSNNKLIEIGNAFTRFINLQELWLDHNRLTKLLDYNFVTMSKLVTLNLSSNCIEKIEDHAFQSLVTLKYLDLGNNLIENISKSLLEKNSDLISLSLLHNHINGIEARSFEGKHITEFNFNDNPVSGTIEKDTFSGIYVDELNLSGGKIAVLGDEVFSTLQFNLLTLNLSSNSIYNISKSAFKSLSLLTELDLSHNKLQNLNFETTDLKNLSIFYAQNNNLTRINNVTFKNLISLTELDLSYNSIAEIEMNAFVELKNLRLLKMKNNNLNNVFDANLFKGLATVQRLELMNTRTTSFRDLAFSGMTKLKNLNSSSGQLSHIEYNAFKDTGSLEVLDLSYNLLEIFSVNTTTILDIKYIHLNNNLLKNVTNQTFGNLTSLKQLNLANNNMLKIETSAFKSLLSIIYLDLSSNTDMEVSGNVFDNLTSLSDVSLQNVKSKFSFKNANATIKILDLTLCDIEDINKVFIFKIENLIKLNLSRNKLSFIDKFSFQKMQSLTWLDLSSNMITAIQPGSFLYLNMINTLNLSANDLSSLQFGVFDGLQNLRVLNLSHNALHSFDANLLHNTQYVTTLYLDYNVIKQISLLDFAHTKITRLSIGGNLLSCEMLAKLKKYNLTNIGITAEVLDYNSENVNGISCQTTFSFNQNITWPVTNNTGIIITTAFASFSKAVDKLRVSIDKVNNNKTVTINIDDLKADLKDVVKSIQTFTSSYSNTTNEYLTNSTNRVGDYLKKLTELTNETRLYFAQITRYMTNQTKDRNISRQYQVLDESKITDNESNEYMKMINEKTEALRSEFKAMYQNWQKSIEDGNDKKVSIAQTNDFGDIKVLLYCITICLAIILIIYLSSFMYSFANKRGNLSNSRHPIGNSIELE